MLWLVQRVFFGLLKECIEAGVVSSRSEAAAFLITACIKARGPLFEKISAKIEEIRNAKEDLRRLLEDEDGVTVGPQQSQSSE